MVPRIAQLREAFLARRALIRNVRPLRLFVHHPHQLEPLLFADCLHTHRSLTSSLRRVNPIRPEAVLAKVYLTHRHIHPQSLLFPLARIQLLRLILRILSREHLALTDSHNEILSV